MRKTLLSLFLALVLFATPSYATVAILSISPPANIDVDVTGWVTASTPTTAVGTLVTQIDYNFSRVGDSYVAEANNLEFVGGLFSFFDIDDSGPGWSMTSTNVKGTFDTPNAPAPLISTGDPTIKHFDTLLHEAELNNGTVDVYYSIFHKTITFTESNPMVGSAPGNGVLVTSAPTTTDNHNYSFPVQLTMPIHTTQSGFGYSIEATGDVVASGTVTQFFNEAPVANNDGVYDVHISDSLMVMDILGNDTDFENDSLTAHKRTDPAAGNLIFLELGAFQYTPSALGSYQFTYEAYDGYDYSDPAAIDINVYNNASDAVDDSIYELFQHGSLLVSDIEGILQNDSDADSDPFIAVLKDDVDHGTLVLNDDGSFEYTPDDTFFGTDTFTYYADDEWGSTLDWATVTIMVNEAIAGDVNLDGKVDSSDLGLLANNWQRGISGPADAEWGMGDLNGDGKVDSSDLGLLANNWQFATALGDPTTVPEPGTLVLLLGALVGLVVIRRKR